MGTSQSLPPGVMHIGGGVSAPRIISKVKPEYDSVAWAAKIEGEVWLSVVIDETGAPTRIKETRSPHPGLTVKAIEAVSQWRFEPGVKYGKKVAVIGSIAVRFNLQMPPPCETSPK